MNIAPFSLFFSFFSPCPLVRSFEATQKWTFSFGTDDVGAFDPCFREEPPDIFSPVAIYSWVANLYGYKGDL